MALELFIVRHGQSEGNRDKSFTGHGPSPLTELGRRQAEAVAEKLLKKPIATVYSSDLPRAMATSKPFCEKSGLAAIATTEIRERNMGAFTGLTFDAVAARYPEGWDALRARDPAYCPPDGESHYDCAARVGGFLDALVARNERGAVVLFSHGVAIHHMLTHLMGLPRELPRPVMFTVDNCSVQHVELRDDRTVRIWHINDIGHLDGLLG